MRPIVSYILLTLSTSATAWQSPGRPCPVPCSISGKDPRNWTDLHGVTALERCNEPVLFDTAVWTYVNDPLIPITLRSCTASEHNVTIQPTFQPGPFIFGKPLGRRSRITEASYTSNSTNHQTSNVSIAAHSCSSDVEVFHKSSALDFHFWNGNPNDMTGDFFSAAASLSEYVASQNDCASTIMFARHKKAVLGMFIGTEVSTSSAATVLRRFISKLERKDSVSQYVAQACRPQFPASWMLGIFADFRGNISATQEALRTWTQGKCLEGIRSNSSSEEIELDLIRATSIPLGTGLYKGFHQFSEPIDEPKKLSRSLTPRADCKAIQAVANDGCYSLSQRCGISQKDFESYNPTKDLCDPVKGIQPKQWVCCSKGSLPDMGPKPNPDGSCATYIVQSNDTCSAISASFGITIDSIKQYNKKTWAWGGCEPMQPGDKLCVSKGDPPMPAQRGNAVCGPQVPGSVRPTDGTNLKDMNPCPLNVCCNVWGQCGTTEDFCIFNPADTKNPGTTQPGKNSCVSSCGMNITNNDVAPEEFRRIAYFEAWNNKRPCLHMGVTDVPKNFTHIHFAFPQITTDFNVNISGVEDEFKKLKSMTGIKRIVSFGGWAFSTEAPTYNVFRDGVTDANRATLAGNIAKFVTDNGLDGVDFDWEYPSEPDIPGIPPSAVEAGKQYRLFLQAVKRRLQKQSVSIAAPASYWYLKGYPIREIAAVVDYIVYMTYDLHGQWDYGNKWSDPGCEDGNCLRSHVNITETKNSLAMITKAGVMSAKVVVGVASYGRSFEMAEDGCGGPMCKFTGSSTESNALPGRCTQTEGYISNAEIREIISDSNDGMWGSISNYHDDSSDSDILIYSDNQWVSYMNDETKASRTNWVQSLNFGGTSDWAVDLDRDYGSDGVGDTDPDSDEAGGGPKCDQSDTYTSLEKISNDTSLEPTCAVMYSLAVLTTMLNDTIAKYNEVNDGYDSKFASYTKYLKKGLPDVLTNYMDYSNGAGQAFFDCHFEGGTDWTGPCPVPRSVHGSQPFGVWKITMTLRDSEGFYKDLNKQTGILQDWIEFFTYKEHSNCQPEPCNNLDLTIDGQARLKKDYDVPNPKDIVSKAMSNQGNLSNRLLIQLFSVGMGLWEGNNEDVLQTLATPVFLVENAIEGMEQAKELGEKEEKEEAKEKLLTILSVVFLVVPFLGEAAAVAAGATTMARIIAMIGAGANLGFSLETVIENPEMAPFAVMDLLSLGRLRSPKDFADAAKFRSAMKDTDVAALGTKFATQDGMIQKIIRVCKK